MKTQYVIVSIAILAVLAAFSAPASADESCWDDTFSDETGIAVKHNVTVADGNVSLAGGTGTDHNGASWTPANGAEISGVHYNIGTFTVAAGTTVYVAPWSDGADGFVEIYAATINIEGTLNGTGRGYPGGAGAGHYYYPNGSCWHPGYGTGDGGTHNKVDGAGQQPGGGQDYKLSAGGAGGHGNSGGYGCGYYCTGSDGGDAYGTPDTKQATIGASGAGGAGGYEGELPPPYKWGGDGGAGGAGILLDAAALSINGAIRANGEDGGDGESGYKGAGGAGGGAGGSIVLNAGTLSGSGSLYTEGGDGGDAGDGDSHCSGGGGGAAGGRVKIWYESSTFTGGYSVMNGIGGAVGVCSWPGASSDGEPGGVGTYYSIQESYSPCTPGGSNYKPSGYLKSTEITPASMESWSTFSANHTENAETNINYQILDATDDSTLCTITANQAAAGYDISTCADATDAIRLYTDLSTTNASNTPVLHDWTVCWIAESPTPSTPFQIYGWVNDSEGAPVNDPDVTVKNLNTSEMYEVENMTSFHYYQVITCSDNVSAGDVLRFVATNETTTNFTYEVTDADMNRGGFEQNITIEATPYPDMVLTAINVYHYSASADAWFNLTNEIDVTVENIGDANATETFNVSLSIEGVPFGKLSVSQLNISESKTVTFEGWTPIGEDCLKPVCQFDWSSEDYNFTAVADCDNDVEERYEGNNKTTVVDMACYNGYMADEPLENVVHGVLHGGVLFTTGDGQYESLSPVGSYRDTHYNIELPAGASVELAHLNVYYTWNEPLGTCPEMEVNITIPNGTVYAELPLMEAYNDIKCECEGSQWVLPWGNYVYNLTKYITENGTYTVRVKNNCTACESFCPAAPGIVLVYEDANASQIEYWINEGADKLIGGRRGDGGSLAWWECINNATFLASGETGNVVNATLGVVSPWGESAPDNILFFNGVEVGRGVYTGYNSLYEKTIDSISMYVGASGNAQVGANLTNVTALYLQGSDNMAGQADDGDCMMPANAFLVVEYTEEEEEKEKEDVAIEDIPVSGTVSGSYVDTNASDNVYESIEEEAITTGKPSGRISYLEHKWTIDVISGTKTNVTFHIKANRTDNTEGDDFKFEYSRDGSTYHPLVTVNTSGELKKYSCKMPNETSGNVTIRVMDTNRTGGYNGKDTIYIDHMFIRSVPGPKMPDLVITNKSETLEDGNFTVTYTVKNIGDDNASASNTTIYIDGTNVLEDPVPALVAGASYTNTVGPFECPCDETLNVTVCADNGNVVNESNENNNCLSNELTCQSCGGLPDLVITDIWCRFVRKNTYDIYYIITNSGGEEADKSDSNWTVNGVEEGTDKIASLGHGQTREEKFTYRSTTAPTTVTVCADYNNNIAESDEANNCMEKNVTCTLP